MLKNNLKNRDKDVEELRAEGALQSDHYDELWKAHEVLLEETRSCVLESYSLARAVKWKEQVASSGAQAATPRGSGHQSGKPNDHVGDPAGWHKGSRIKATVVSETK